MFGRWNIRPLTRRRLGLSTTVVCDMLPAVLLPIFNYGWDAFGFFANERDLAAKEFARFNSDLAVTRSSWKSS